MWKVDRREEMAELDKDATEGQMADYYAAELSGDMGDWRLGIVKYKCKCGVVLDLVSDYLKDYNSLIIDWHKKARRGDYFSKYIFEYLAFNAFIKSLFLDADNDRIAIQRLKRNKELKRQYLDKINKYTQFDLKSTWSTLIRELKQEPLYNSSKDYDYPEIGDWWNIMEDYPNANNKSELEKGVIHSLEDWGNMIEFWYGVRNNLFHGGKNLTIKRDQFLVEHAFKTLNVFMKIVITSL